MNSQTTRNIIVASSMAAVLGIGVAIYALRSEPVTAVAPNLQGPTRADEIPATPAAVAQIPDAKITVVETPDAPAAIADNQSVDTNSAKIATAPAAEPKLARNLHLATASTSAVPTKGTGTRSGSAAATSKKPAAQSVADSVDAAKSADELTTTPTDSSPTDEQQAGTSTEFAPSDSQITAAVKSEIAGDGLSKDANIGVTTTDGVVALTGSLANQDAIDHVKDVVGKVKDVKSVDTSALTLASL